MAHYESPNIDVEVNHRIRAHSQVVEFDIPEGTVDVDAFIERHLTEINCVPSEGTLTLDGPMVTWRMDY